MNRNLTPLGVAYDLCSGIVRIYSNQGEFPSHVVQMGDWKLIERYEDGRVHLYNLAKDIGDRMDVARDHPANVTEMRTTLHQRYLEVDAKFLQEQHGSGEPWMSGRN